MTTRDQRNSLISPEDVGGTFSGDAIARLATAAGIGAAEVQSFGIGLVNAVRTYLHNAQGLHAGEIRDAIEELSNFSMEALSGNPDAIEKAAKALADLPDDAREVLEINAVAGRNHVPNSEEICDPKRGHESLLLLSGLCVSGAEFKPGRLRPGGKQSRPTFKEKFAGPSVRRGRPKNTNELILTASLAPLYLRKTGRIPQRPERWNEEEDYSPFVSLLEEVLILVGANSCSADDLVRQHKKLQEAE
jgi:hypothetical protein